MHSGRLIVPFAILSGFAAMAACSSDSNDGSGETSTPDAASPVADDSGARADAGTPVDSGAPTDSGTADVDADTGPITVTLSDPTISGAVVAFYAPGASTATVVKSLAGGSQVSADMPSGTTVVAAYRIFDVVQILQVDDAKPGDVIKAATDAVSEPTEVTESYTLPVFSASSNYEVSNCYRQAPASAGASTMLFSPKCITSSDNGVFLAVAYADDGTVQGISSIVRPTSAADFAFTYPAWQTVPMTTWGITGAASGATGYRLEAWAIADGQPGGYRVYKDDFTTPTNGAFMRAGLNTGTRELRLTKAMFPGDGEVAAAHIDSEPVNTASSDLSQLPPHFTDFAIETTNPAPKIHFETSSAIPEGSTLYLVGDGTSTTADASVVNVSYFVVTDHLGGPELDAPTLPPEIASMLGPTVTWRIDAALFAHFTSGAAGGDTLRQETFSGFTALNHQPTGEYGRLSGDYHMDMSWWFAP